MKIYITSDHHLFHKNIIKHCNRPFTDEYEMNNIILEKHNSVVKENDTVIFLGDISAGLKNRNAQLKEILLKFNGNKILLKGNHDYLTDDFYKSCGFQSVGHYLIVGKYFLNHYGLENNTYSSNDEKRMIEIFKNSKCSEIFHGHKHTSEVELNELNGFNPRHNVCLDLHDFYPTKLDI